jgi:glycosyltransferase involved in cell wall biosynthesis
MPSFGEGWCRPALDALGFGKTPIVTDNTGMVDFINNQNGWVVPSRETPVTTVNRPIQYIYTSRETWFEIDILGLQKAMREAYTNKAARQLKASQGLRDIAHYSYESIGLKIKKLLEKK